jgi:hypothetical protein
MAMVWPPGYEITFPSAQERARDVANAAAQQEYNRARLNLESEQMAINKAQQAWTEAYQTAQLTGYFQGQPTMATRQMWAQTFGGWEQPQAGQTTLDLEQQRWAQAAGLAGAFGTWYRPGTQPVPGQTTLQQQQQAFAQGLASQQEARAAQNQLQQQAQAYLQLLSSLRGPADWAKYQQVLGATPGGMRDLVAAAMGQYLPGGGATTGVQPTPVSLQTMFQDVSGQPWQGTAGAGMPTGANWDWWTARVPTVTSATPEMQVAGPSGLQPGQMSAIQQAAEARWGQGEWRQWLFEDLVNRGTPVERAIAQAVNGAVPESTVQEVINASGINATRTGGQSPQLAQAAAGGQAPGPTTPIFGPTGATTYPAAQTLGGLPLPNQIAPQTWRNLAPSQQQLLIGAYEAAGWHPQDVLTLFSQSLPRYASNAPTAGTYRLQG